MKLLQNTKAYIIVLTIIALFITLITYRVQLAPISLGLDQSWIFAINYLSNKHLLGNSSFFTYGPLGFLRTALPIGHNMLIASIFWLITRFCLVFFMIRLFLDFNQNKSIYYKLVLGVLFVCFLAILDSHFLLLFLTILLILTFNITKKNSWLIIFAAIIIAVNFLIKPGNFLYCFFVLFGYLFFYTITTKQYKLVIQSIITIIISYILLWIIVTGGIKGILQYIFVSYQFIIGNSNAMSISPYNNWLYIVLMFGFIMLSALAFTKRPIMSTNGPILFIIFILPIYTIFKYSYGREDGHVLFMQYFSVLMYLFFILLINGKSYRRLLLLILFGLLAIGSQIGSHHHKSLYNLTFNIKGVKNFQNNILHTKRTKQSLLSKYKKYLKSGRLPKTMLSIINHRTVDIYPYNLSLIAANQLNWIPRPVLQSYVSYTSYLDNLNAAHFTDQNNAPDFIIWSPPILDSIDNKYTLNSEPNTIYQIFKWYKLIRTDGNFLLFRKQQKPLLSEPVDFKQINAHWNEWIAVPKTKPNTIIRAKLAVYKRLIEKLKLALYKLNDVMIDYKFYGTGTVVSHRLVIDTANHGVWVAPYKYSLLYNNKIHSTKMLPQINNRDKIKRAIDILRYSNYSNLYIRGWAFIPNKNAAKQSIKILLAGTKHHLNYYIDTSKLMRPDVAQAYNNSGINLANSGFEAKANLYIPYDTYKLYLVLQYPDRTFFSKPIKTITLNKKSINKNNVAAIRFRHSKYDYFTNNLKITWQFIRKINNEKTAS